MFVKPSLDPTAVLARARAAHDEAARRMMRAAEFHLKAAARIDRELKAVTSPEKQDDRR
jgi:hypothetical protein